MKNNKLEFTSKKPTKKTSKKSGSRAEARAEADRKEKKYNPLRMYMWK